VDFVEKIPPMIDYSLKTVISMIGIHSSKYYAWTDRIGEENHHNGATPKETWLLEWEKKTILAYARKHPGIGYRLMTYEMMDLDIVAVSPASTYRVLYAAGLMNKWNQSGTSRKGDGFDQPTAIHQHWHIDIKYVRLDGMFLYLISIIDGYSRYIVHHELRLSMMEYDVEITVQRALELFPGYHPRIISDNGSQFISKDFAKFLISVGLQHVRTSVAYPQSNGKIERYHRTISEECLRKSSLIDIEDARKQIADFIHYYNTKRLHSSLYYVTPEDVLCNRQEEILKGREEKLRMAKLNRIQVNQRAS
jgi:transposase InsO family protein